MAAKPPDYIEVPIAFRKAQIAQFAAASGCRNASEYEGHRPGCLEFVTPVARLNKATGLYEGVLRFLPADSNERAPRTDFAALFHAEQAAGTTPAIEEE